MPGEKTSIAASSDSGQPAQPGSDIDRFSETVSAFIESEIPRRVSAGLSSLADMLTETIPDIALEVVIRKHAEKWRLQEYKTLNDMFAPIAHELPSSLVQSDVYNRTVRQWADPIDADLSRRWSEIRQGSSADGGGPGEIKLHIVRDCPCLNSPDNGLIGGMKEYVETILPAAITAKLIQFFLSIPGWGFAPYITILGHRDPRTISITSKEVVAKVTGGVLPKVARGLFTDAIIAELLRHPFEDAKGMPDSVREIVLGELFAATLIDAAKRQAYELLMKRKPALGAP